MNWNDNDPGEVNAHISKLAIAIEEGKATAQMCCEWLELTSRNTYFDKATEIIKRELADKQGRFQRAIGHGYQPDPQNYPDGVPALPEGGTGQSGSNSLEKQLAAKDAMIARITAKLYQWERVAAELLGTFAEVGICEPAEGFAEYPQGLVTAVQDMKKLLAAKDEEYEREKDAAEYLSTVNEAHREERRKHVAEIERFKGIVEQLAAWSKKWPKGAVIPMSSQGEMFRELDLIEAVAKAALAEEQPQ